MDKARAFYWLSMWDRAIRKRREVNGMQKLTQGELDAILEFAPKPIDLSFFDLNGAYLGGAYLGGANLKDANLVGANLVDANLGGANLVDANLNGAYLNGAYLVYANLNGANLAYANLEGAYLGGVYLRGAKLNWSSSGLLSEILIQNADYDEDLLQFAGIVFIGSRVNWDWKYFMNCGHPALDKALRIWSKYVQPGDDLPDEFTEWIKGNEGK